MDLAKYRKVFLEDAIENLAEMSRALLELEKDPVCTSAIDLVFRMAHSIKGMAATLEFDSITEIAHRLEDRMQEIRNAGRVEGPEGIALLFRGLEGLESMIGTLRETDTSPPPDPELAQILSTPLEFPSIDEKKNG